MRIGYLMQAGVPEVRHPPFSGPAVHVRQVIDELRQLGHEVRLLALYNDQIWRSDDLTSFVPVTVYGISRRPRRWLESVIRRVQRELRLPYAALFEGLRFARACQQELDGFDLFYERMGWLGYGAGLAARRMQIPLVVEVNGDHLAEFESLGIAPHGVQRWLALALMQRAVRRVTHVVATGEGWAQRYAERWRVDRAQVSVVENGTEMVDRLAREALRAFRPLADSAVTAVYAGGLEPWHGVGQLLQALAPLRSRKLPLQLLIIGDGSERARLARQIDQLGLASCARLIGHVPPLVLSSYLAEADIGLSPYCGRVEFSGLKLLDYKAAGLATIASGQDGQPAVLIDGQTGRIVPPCDVDALSAALLELTTDHELRRRMGQTARLEAEQQHSWRQTAVQLDLLFQRLLHQ